MTKVVIANGWVSPEGRTYKAGQTVEVEPGVARDLISRHKARPAPEGAAKTEVSKPVAAAKEAKNV